MAKKKGPAVITADPATTAAATGEDDLAILHPDRAVVIAGRRLTMREYGFVEGLRLMPLLDPLIADLRGILENRLPLPGSEQIPVFLGNHADALVQLVAAAADVEPNWITGLSLSDGHELIWWWWVVNGPFCVSNAGQRVAVARAAQQAREQTPRGGQTSTACSSPRTTETPPPSAG